MQLSSILITQRFIILSLYLIKIKLNLFVGNTKFIKNRVMTIEEQEKIIYKKLKREREKQNISQLELSYSSGVSQNMITYIENGKRTPTIHTILKLCNALKINPSALFIEVNISSSDMEKEKAKLTVLDLIDQYM